MQRVLETIRHEMAQQGITQRDMAEMIGLGENSQAQIHRALLGRCRLVTLKKILAALDLRLEVRRGTD